jgi:prepilin-type N-terminal cleavage/methylation domain-containing protein
MQKNRASYASIKGFTLIELLIVIAVIAIIAAVVFVALDPLTRFQDARDSTRWTDVTGILDAVKVDQVDNKGSYVAEISGLTAGEVYMISNGIPGDADCDGENTYCDVDVTTEGVPGDHCVNLRSLVTEGYLGDIPISPIGNSAASWNASTTGYTIQRDSTGIVHVRSCESENSTDISVSR